MENLDDEEASGHSELYLDDNPEYISQESKFKEFYIIEPPKIEYNKLDFKKEKPEEKTERIFDPIDPDNFKFFTVSDNCLDKVAANPEKIYEKIGITEHRKTIRLLAYVKRAA